MKMRVGLTLGKEPAPEPSIQDSGGSGAYDIISDKFEAPNVTVLDRRSCAGSKSLDTPGSVCTSMGDNMHGGQGSTTAVTDEGAFLQLGRVAVGMMPLEVLELEL